MDGAGGTPSADEAVRSYQTLSSFYDAFAFVFDEVGNVVYVSGGELRPQAEPGSSEIWVDSLLHQYVVDSGCWQRTCTSWQRTSKRESAMLTNSLSCLGVCRDP
jgi:hypothetical protein